MAAGSKQVQDAKDSKNGKAAFREEYEVGRLIELGE